MAVMGFSRFRATRASLPIALSIVLLSGCSATEGPGGQTLQDGVMPDFSGLTPNEVFSTLDALDVHHGEVRWPDAFGAFGTLSRDSDEPSEWPEDADDWTVCEQDLAPGSEIERQFVWDVILFWGKGCTEFKVIPDFVGLDGEAATELGWSRGIQLDGVSEFDGDKDVCEQTPVADGSRAQGDGGWLTVDVTASEDCGALFAERAERDAQVKELDEASEQARAEREARERLLNDPNTPEGGRKFINEHEDKLSAFVGQLNEYEDYVRAGTPTEGGVWDALTGDYPSMPFVSSFMSERAPERFQERWTSVLENLVAAEDEFWEAHSLYYDDVLSPSELVPYVQDVRAMTGEALGLVRSIPYPDLNQ